MKISDYLQKLPTEICDIIYDFARDDGFVVILELDYIFDYYRYWLDHFNLINELHLYFIIDELIGDLMERS